MFHESCLRAGGKVKGDFCECIFSNLLSYTQCYHKWW